MNENKHIIDQALEMDFAPFFKQVKKNILYILVVACIFSVVAFGFSSFILKKKYSSNATIYITPKLTEQGTIDFDSLQTNSRMVNNYIEIFKGETILSKVASKVGMDDYESVLETLEVTSVENTEIISITSTTQDPNISKEIVANMIAIFRKEMIDLLNVSNLTVINRPKVNTEPVFPNNLNYTILGFVFGFILSCFVLFFKFFFDKRLCNSQEAESYLDLPVLAVIPFKK